MLHTQEFYEIMDFFENNTSKTISTGSQGLKREEKEHWANRYYYCDSNANEAFRVFFQGYMLGKNFVQNSDCNIIS